MIGEFFEAVFKWDQWVYLGWHDIKARYRRTTLGPLWLVIVNFITIFCISMLGSILFKIRAADLGPYVAAGMVGWMFISTLVIESCSIFTSNAWMLQNLKINIFTLTLRMFLRNFIIFLHNLGVLLAIFLIIGYDTNILNFLVIIPAILFVILPLTISSSLVIGFLCTRYRDFIQVINAILSLLMIATPIWWKPEMLGADYRYLADWNPFYHLLTLVRNPLMSKPLDIETMLICFLITIAMTFMAVVIFKSSKNKLVFWL